MTAARLQLASVLVVVARWSMDLGVILFLVFIVVSWLMMNRLEVLTVGERSNFKKIPTHTQDHGVGIATRGESVVHVPS